jgi:hypothetical protein
LPWRLVAVYEGTSLAGDRLAAEWSPIGSSLGLPDFTVFDPSARQLAWGGVLATGFFGSRWEVVPELTALRDPAPPARR